MASRILNAVFGEFAGKFFRQYKHTQDKEKHKLFERFVNYTILTKIIPDLFDDKASFDVVDVDKDNDATFGIDAFALVINGALISKKEQIKALRVPGVGRWDVSYIFIQTKYTESFESKGFLGFVESVKSILDDNSSIALNKSLSDVKSLIDELYVSENLKYLKGMKPKCELYYATASLVEPDSLLLSISKNAKNDIEKLSIRQCDVKHINENYLIDSWNELENRKQVIIKFPDRKGCGTIADVTESFIGFLSIQEFLKIITGFDGNIRKNLFYENVRDYQGDSISVNSEILSTLDDASLLDKFVLLNNGVTIVAKALQYINDSEFEINDYYIVNGCQTSNILFKKSSLIKDSDLKVPVKIINTKNNDVIAKIIRSTNRQTPIPKEVFIALGDFSKGLQRFYSSCQFRDIKFYYERRVGEYRNNCDFEDGQVVTLHSQIRNFTAIMLGKPYLVSTRNPSAILEMKKDMMYKDEHSLYPYYLSSVLYFSFDQMLDMGVVDRKYAISRYWICWIARMLITGSFNVNFDKGRDKFYEKVLTEIESVSYLDDCFLSACAIFDAMKDEYQQKHGNHFNRELIKQRYFNQEIESHLSMKKFYRKS